MAASLRVVRKHPDAQLPKRGSPEAAGYDLYAVEDTVIAAQGKAIVKTGLIMEIPEGCYGRIAPRSSLAAKHHLDVGAGVIDRDYRGEVGVVMFNFAQQEFTVKKGERIAQLILECIFTPLVEEVGSLSDTSRGEGGFGSTGTN
ncbi:uncharacterized protein MONBRDRAFT_21377 [Monosiga brevicollis MX1]|uniref:Deoxyuridine 5'-triphosphate nucleotidohydrolase n=1 Tax=Monosiga brevicollis TaxID=81824 RepID=A9UWC3_MONBE|nr:uncharacterized protein MONBRDRAFT_21377 [Monosiga brevicollis MX1]EDQ90742.1 predicted protein [Monosiga brevicollis MX1]|eukprot:XP_001744793.1 hypothetical protein [Monosiga brevicollis MX1]